MGLSARPRVVVIGTGLAGLSCCEALAERDVAVTALSLGRAGRDGASHCVTRYAPWILLTAPSHPDDDADRFHRDLEGSAEGHQIPSVCRALADGALPTMRELERLLRLQRLDAGPVRLPGDSVPRGHRFHAPGGRGLMAPLLARCRDLGVEVRERQLAVGLSMQSERVTAVAVLEHGDQEPKRIAADAVVLAAGGHGRVFPCSTQPWCRGTGLVMGTLAGAPLHLPHLGQALPVVWPGQVFPSSAAILRGRLLFDGREQSPPRDLQAATILVAEALRAGRRVRLILAADEDPLVLRQLKPIGEQGFSLEVAAHQQVGGVAVDSWGRTGVAGLYACGESAGGAQGVRRTMGTGLVEARLFGVRCGRAIAEDVGALGDPQDRGSEESRWLQPAPEPERLDRELDRLLRKLPQLRPVDELTAVLACIRGWRRPDALRGHRGQWRAAIRARAVRTIFESELRVRNETVMREPVAR